MNSVWNYGKVVKVVKVIGVPYQLLGKWHINVEVEHNNTSTLMEPVFKTQEEAASIKIGSKILI